MSEPAGGETRWCCTRGEAARGRSREAAAGARSPSSVESVVVPRETRRASAGTRSPTRTAIVVVQVLKPSEFRARARDEEPRSAALADAHFVLVLCRNSPLLVHGLPQPQPQFRVGTNVSGFIFQIYGHTLDKKQCNVSRVT